MDFTMSIFSVKLADVHKVQKWEKTAPRTIRPWTPLRTTVLKWPINPVRNNYKECHYQHLKIMNELRFLDNIRSETIRNVQLNMPFKENKIEGTPILKLALVKRLQVKKYVKKFVKKFVKQFAKKFSTWDFTILTVYNTGQKLNTGIVQAMLFQQFSIKSQGYSSEV